jgi:hypothetical protein
LRAVAAQLAPPPDPTRQATQPALPEARDAGPPGAEPEYCFQLPASSIGPIALPAAVWAQACAADPELAALKPEIAALLQDVRGPQYWEPRESGLDTLPALRRALARGDYWGICLFYTEIGNQELEVVVRCARHLPEQRVYGIVRVPAGDAEVSILPGVADRRGIPVYWTKSSWQIHLTRHPELTYFYKYLGALAARPTVIGQDKSLHSAARYMHWRYYLSPGDPLTARIWLPEPAPGRYFHWLLNYQWDTHAQQVIALVRTAFLNGWDWPVDTGAGGLTWIRT